eukprot:2475259-Amphidinium_carterae.1
MDESRKIVFSCENLCQDNSVSLSKVLQAIGSIDKQTEEFCKVHLRWKKKKCADPQTGDFPSFVSECRGDKVMLSLIHPSNYPTSTKALRKISEKAAVNRDKWNTTFVNKVNKQKTFTEVVVCHVCQQGFANPSIGR